jgi:hypothetical protein
MSWVDAVYGHLGATTGAALLTRVPPRSSGAAQRQMCASRRVNPQPTADARWPMCGSRDPRLLPPAPGAPTRPARGRAADERGGPDPDDTRIMADQPRLPRRRGPEPAARLAESGTAASSASTNSPDRTGRSSPRSRAMGRRAGRADGAERQRDRDAVPTVRQHRRPARPIRSDGPSRREVVTSRTAVATTPQGIRAASSTISASGSTTGWITISVIPAFSIAEMRSSSSARVPMSPSLSTSDGTTRSRSSGSIRPR